MNSESYGFLCALFAIISGVSFDYEAIGLGIAFGFVAALCFGGCLVSYLDSPPKKDKPS